MNKTSSDKIKSATPFLIWFRRCLPQSLQVQVRPYLDRPYQLALTILDRCDAPQPIPVKDMAQTIGVSPQTVKQVLLALKEGGMTFAVSPTTSWQLSESDPPDVSLLETASVTVSSHNPA
ncbi:MAG: Rrf2 family transcriptional regulator [Leptolyngbyaceae cyanobacterium CSU_1_3]|nr:Rrf2 family transcriptional regulator [Leptolyngbyaceae cyanobacterium CSU_1_3]